MKETFAALLSVYGESFEILKPSETFDAVYGDETAITYSTGLATGVFFRELSRFALEPFGDIKPADLYCVVKPALAKINDIVRRDTEEFQVLTIASVRWMGEKIYDVLTLKKR